MPAVPDQVEQAGAGPNGAAQVLADSLLAIGKFPRLSAAALAASLVPTTAAGHRFWESDDKQERAQQQVHFLKNLSMLGGLLIAAGNRPGTRPWPGAAWTWPSWPSGRRRWRPRAGHTRPRRDRKTVTGARAEAKAAQGGGEDRGTRTAGLSAKGGVKAGKASAVTRAYGQGGQEADQRPAGGLEAGGTCGPPGA